MAEGTGNEPGKGSKAGGRRARRDPGKAGETPAKTTSPGGPGSGRASSDSPSTSDGDPGNPLGLEHAAAFTPPDEAGAAPLVEPAPVYEAPPPELIEWTGERAAAVVKAGGFLLHAADPLGHEPGGERLWRATVEDCEAIGPPLARILNRYAPARRLAGKSDEVELTFALGAYGRRNLALRGQLVRAAKAEAEAAAGAADVWPDRGEGEPPPGGIEGTFGAGPEPEGPS